MYTWIFDAKYRIEDNNAPEDAVNEMHRYRDAILWASATEGGIKEKSVRESIGAFVLYPGNESEGNSFPQIDSIEQVNIGAYPLLPVDEHHHAGKALDGKIKSLLKIQTDYNSIMEQESDFFTSVPAVKKAASGVISVCAVRSEMAAQKYWQTCRFYRLPVFQAEKIKVSPEEWDHIAPQKGREGHFGLFPVIKHEKLRREEIVNIYRQSGVKITDSTEKQDNIYWLFYLGDPVAVPENLTNLKRGRVVHVVEV